MIGRNLSHYTIVDRIGAGGMGEVYRARDPRLGRDVAVKVVRPELAQRPERVARFEDEARAVAALNHPNILSVFDVGREEGIPFLVTEMLEGETLRRAMARGALGDRRAIEYAAQIADGLAAAHAKNIVHRDLKPENIFLTRDGHLKILDFGLAKLIESDPEHPVSTESPTAALTGAGVVVGTPGYMSPEQLSGRPADTRSDIFALGVVLFEMLSGRRPFVGSNAAEISASILRDEPQPLSDVGHPVPPTVERLVRQCLEKEPGRRFESAHDLAHMLRAVSATGEVRKIPRFKPIRRSWLRWAAAAACIVAAVASIGLLAAWWLGRDSRPPQYNHVAVMPFADYTGGPSTAHVAESVGSGLIARLSGALPDLQVRSRSEAWQYRDLELEKLGKRLRVGVVIEGAVSGRSDRLELTASLIDARSGQIIRSERMVGSSGELTMLEDQLSDSVIRLFRILLSPYEQRRIAEDTGFTFASYDLYLTAERQLDAATDATGYLPAINLFRQAVRRDERFAMGWAGLSLANWVRAARRGIVESMDDAEYAARRALELDPGLPEGHLALARVLRETGRREEAQSELEKALASHSQPDQIQRQFAEDLERVGDMEGAEAALRAATAIAPSEWRNHNALGRLQWRQGNNEAALSSFRTAAGLAPAGINNPHVNVAAVLIQLGQFEAAIKAGKEIPGPITDATLASNLGTAHFFMGDFKNAEEFYRMAVELRPRDIDVRRNLGDALEALGKDDEARDQYAEARRLAEAQLAQDPDDVELAVLAAFLAAKSGDCVAAIRRADEVVHVAPDSTDIVHQAAYVDALCGRREMAFERIERALNLGASAEIIRIEPEFESLANDPEFQALVGGPH